MIKFTVCYEIGEEVKSASESNEDIIIYTEEGSRTKILLEAKKSIKLLSFEQHLNFAPDKNDACFFNGYQSWTDTKEFYIYEREKNVNRLPQFLINAFSFDRYGDAGFYRYDKNKLHGYDIFYCKGKREKFVFNLNYTAAYLIIELNKKDKTLTLSYDYNGTEIAIGNRWAVADYCIFDSVAQGMACFESMFPRKNTAKLFGYTSWYNYYQNISQDTLLRDLEALDKRFDLFQIDDGYETKVGDWLQVDKTKFPDGLKPIADAAHAKGLKAGIWLAPFVAQESSELFTLHKEWFLRFDNGDYVKCGSNWGGFYALDLNNEDARNYIKSCLQHYVDMGFDFFKLDFLYAANIYVKKGTSRSAAAEKAYAFLRECLGSKLILGCGATVFNCIGKFDYLRVGPDVSLKFDDVWYMRFMHRERISTKVTLQNTVYRSFFNNRLFANDPDVFLLRDDNISLSPKQKEALITINALFGNVLMTSDNIREYSQVKLKLLADMLELFYHAEVLDYTRRGEIIEIHYALNGCKQTVKYNTKRGKLL